VAGVDVPLAFGDDRRCAGRIVAVVEGHLAFKDRDENRTRMGLPACRASNRVVVCPVSRDAVSSYRLVLGSCGGSQCVQAPEPAVELVPTRENAAYQPSLTCQPKAVRRLVRRSSASEGRSRREAPRRRATSGTSAPSCIPKTVAIPATFLPQRSRFQRFTARACSPGFDQALRVAASRRIVYILKSLSS